MALNPADSPDLDPQLYEDWDDEDDLRWKAPLAALIAGTQTPRQAAQAIDNLLRAETSSRLQKLHDYAASHRMTAEDRESNDWTGLYAPNATALAEAVICSWCRVCTAFPPHSQGQDKLINLLEELKGLSRWMAPETRPDEDGEVFENEYWAFGKNWIGLENQFRRQRDEMRPYADDPESRLRWQNFQSAMARVTADGLIYCAPFTLLQNLFRAGESNDRTDDFDIAAAAQWVLWPVESRYVYIECLKKQTTEDLWEPWSMEKWKIWKKVFSAAAEDGRYRDSTRESARQAVRQMKEVEAEVNEEGSVGSKSEVE